MEALNTHQVQQVVFEHHCCTSLFSAHGDFKNFNHWEFDNDDKNTDHRDSDNSENDDGEDDNGHSNDDGEDDDDNDDGDEDEDEDSENDAIQISSTAVYSQACIRERGPTESYTETPITNLSTRIFWSLDKNKVYG